MAVTWKSVTDALTRGHGFDGDATDLNAVKSFVAEKGIDLVDAEEKPLDLDALHKSTRRFVVDDTPQPENIKAAKPLSRAHAASSKGAFEPSRSYVDGAKKAYAMRAKAGKTVFDDVDMAESAGAFFRLACTEMGGVKHYSQKDNDLDIIAKTGSIYNPATGGVLVPDEYRAQMIYLYEKYGVFRRNANVVPMTRDNLKMPRTTSVPTMSPIGENPTMTATDAGLDLVQLTAQEWGCLIKIPNALLDDSAINVSDYYATIFVESQTKAEDNAAFIGDGTSTYNNVYGLQYALPSGAYISGSGNAWSAITEGDINKIIGSVQNVDVTRCKLYCSRQFYAQVLQPMYTASGRGFQSEFQSNFGLQSGVAAWWKGWPVEFVQVMATTSASGAFCCYFGDLTAASMLGDRRDLTIATSEHVYFANNSFGIRAISRFAVNIHGDGRGSTVGPIACLKTT